MPANNISLSLRDSLMLNVTMPELQSAGVYMAASRYNVISQLTDKLGKPFQVSNRKVTRSKIGNLGVAVDIATRTASGSNLVITFSDPNFEQVRVGDMVQSAGVQARVTVSAPGTITITPWTDATGANLDTFGAEFAVGARMSVLFDSTKDSGSNGKSSLTYSPETDFNYAATKRDACHITRDDLMAETYQKYNGKNWAFAQEQLMRIRFSKYCENQLLISNRNQKGGHTTSGGFIWAAKTYGTHYLQATAEWTEDDLLDFIDAIKDKTGTSVTKLLFLAGTKWIANFQRVVVRGQVNAVGTQNTLGGAAVKGIHATTFTYNNITIDIVDYEAFNDSVLFANQISTITGGLKSQSSCLVLNCDPVETTEGIKPAFEKFYHSFKPVHYFYVPGIVNLEGLDPSKSLNMDYTFTASDYDGCTAGILVDDGVYHWGAERHAYWELAS